MARSKTKTPKQIDFTTTADEKETIEKIAARAVQIPRRQFGSPWAKRSALDWQMDIAATHCNGMPLQLGKLLSFDDASFAHDVFGIGRHLNRKTGALQNCFLPRCAWSEAVPGTEVA